MCEKLREAWFPQKKDIQDYTVDELLMLLFGILSPMSILMFAGNTIFAYLILLVVLLAFLRMLQDRGDHLGCNQQIVWPILLFLTSILSVAFCITGNLPAVFRNGEEVRIIWEALFLLFFIGHCSFFGRYLVRYYVQGVYYSSITQLVWCYLQFIYNSATGSNLNKLVFSDILHLDVEYGYGDRMSVGVGSSSLFTGMCWHPSNLAPLFCIGYILSSKWPVKLMILFMSAMCGSRTAFLGVVICAAADLFVNVRKKGIVLRQRPLIVIIGLVSVILLTVYAILNGSSIFSELIKKLLLYVEKTSYKNNSSTQAHFNYWLCFPKAIRFSELKHILFGYGPECSGYIGTEILGMYEGLKWVLECDYMNIFWNYGLVGFLLRYLWYVKELFGTGKVARRAWALWCAFAVMGIVYNVLLNWVMIFLYSVFLINGRLEHE